MIAIVEFVRNGKTLFTYEFPLESDNSIVGVPWSDGVKEAIEEFRRQYSGISLFDVSLKFASRG